MKTFISVRETTYVFNGLNYSDTFTTEDSFPDVFMKVNIPNSNYNAVNLESGEGIWFEENEVVIPVHAVGKVEFEKI